jgi:hypothetical protein
MLRSSPQNFPSAYLLLSWALSRRLPQVMCGGNARTNPQLCSCRYGAILKHKTRSLRAHYAVHIKYGHDTQKSCYITTCCHISDVGTNDVNSCRNGGTQRSIVAPSLRYGQKPNYLLPLKERSKCRTANDSSRKKQKKEGR